MDLIAFLIGGAVIGAAAAYILTSQARKLQVIDFEKRVAEAAEKLAEQKLRQSGATLKGQIGERFAPFVPGFGYEAAGARFLGSPVDYVVFDGISNGEIREIAFVEVKTGKLPLTNFQKQVQSAIQEGRIKFRIVELPG